MMAGGAEEAFVEVVVVDEVPVQQRNEAGSIRPGKGVRQSLLRDDAPDGLSFTVSRNTWLPGPDAATSPRHHHAFQQIRWTEDGSVNFGPDQYVLAGDIAYFPKGAYYGPQKRESGTVVTIQFGFNGEKQHGSAKWDKYQAEALERLRARGTFEDGLFIEVDPETGERRVSDSVQALYEEQYRAHTGEDFVVPAEGYDAAILMHPQAFDYAQASPGVEIRNMGRFFDHPGPAADVRFAMVRLTDGGSHTFGADRAQVAWTISAGLWVEGGSYPRHTWLYSPRDEKLQVSGVDGVELHVVEFPCLDLPSD
jgi:hypothetical protein